MWLAGPQACVARRAMHANRVALSEGAREGGEGGVCVDWRGRVRRGQVCQGGDPAAVPRGCALGGLQTARVRPAGCAKLWGGGVRVGCAWARAGGGTVYACLAQRWGRRAVPPALKRPGDAPWRPCLQGCPGGAGAPHRSGGGGMRAAGVAAIQGGTGGPAGRAATSGVVRAGCAWCACVGCGGTPAALRAARWLRMWSLQAVTGKANCQQSGPSLHQPMQRRAVSGSRRGPAPAARPPQPARRRPTRAAAPQQGAPRRARRRAPAAAP